MFRFEYKSLILSIMFFLILIPLTNSSSISLGISPGYLNLGEIEPGDSKIARFYVITPSDELFLVYLGSSQATDMLIFNLFDEDLLPFYSEEDPSSWINFINNPVKLLPPNETLEKTEGGGIVKGMREISFIIKVPENAEPGYHIGEIHTDPQVATGIESVSIKSTIPIKYIFKVKGNAVRSGEILDITTNNIKGDRLWLKIFYKNTGNVTTFVDSGNIVILNNEKRAIGSIPTTRGYVKPGDIKELDGFMDYSYIEEGTYPVKAEVSFLTGVAKGESVITIVKPSDIPTGKIVQEEKKFPLWVVLALIIIVILYILFKR